MRHVWPIWKEKKQSQRLIGGKGRGKIAWRVCSQPPADWRTDLWMNGSRRVKNGRKKEMENNAAKKKDGQLKGLI